MTALSAILTAFAVVLAWAWFVTRDRYVFRNRLTPEQWRRLAQANRDIAAAFGGMTIPLARATVAFQDFGEAMAKATRETQAALARRPRASIPYVLREDGSVDHLATQRALLRFFERHRDGA